MNPTFKFKTHGVTSLSLIRKIKTHCKHLENLHKNILDDYEIDKTVNAVRYLCDGLIKYYEQLAALKKMRPTKGAYAHSKSKQ